MITVSTHFWPRSQSQVSRSGIAALGLLALTPTLALAQPADPPTARQRVDQMIQKTRDEMMARMRAPRPPVVESRALSPDGTIAVSYSSDGTVSLWNARTGKDISVIHAYDASPSLNAFNIARFSPDGKLLFTLGKKQVKPGEQGGIRTYDINGITDETTQSKLWDVATGKLLWTLPPLNDGVKWSTAVNTVAFSANGKLIATKARYGPIHLWDVGSGQLVRTLRVPFLNMNALAFSPDGKTLAGGGYRSTSYQGEIVLWDVESGELERSLKQPDDDKGTQILAIAFSPDGKLLAAGGGFGKYESINEGSGRFNAQYGGAQLWDVKSGVSLFTIGRPVHRNLVTTLAFSPDSTRLATGSFDQTVGLWNTQLGSLLSTATRYGTQTEEKTTETKPGEPGILRTDTIDDGFGQATMTTRKTQLADPNAPGTVTTIRNKINTTGIGVQDLIFAGDGKTLDILSKDRTVRAWDLAAPQSDPLRRFIPGSSSAYADFDFGPDSRQLVSGEYFKQVRFWTADNQQETQSFLAHSNPVNKVALAPLAPDAPRFSDQPPLLVTASNLLQWRNTGENTGEGRVTGFEVKLWDSETHEVQHKFTVPEFSLTALAVSPGGRWIAAAGGRLGPLPAGAFAGNGGVGVGVGGPVDPLVPADAKQEATGVVLLWDAATGELKQKLSVEDDIPHDLKFSPDGNILAGDSDQAGATFWDAATGAKIRTLDEDRPTPLKPGERRVSTRGTPQSKTTIAFSADGSHLVRSHKGAVKLWNVATGALESTFNIPENTVKIDSEILALTPDGKIVATAGVLEQLKLWDLTTGKMLWQSPEKTSVTMMKMAPNGKTLAASSGSDIRLWNITQATQGIVN